MKPEEGRPAEVATPGRVATPAEIEEREQDSERFWKTPNTLDAQGLQAAEEEPQPEDVALEGLSVVEDSPDSAPAAS